MSVIGSNVLAGASGQAAEDTGRSVRFNSGDSAYLSRTPSSAGNRKTWTWAAWVKRSALSSSSEFALFGMEDDVILAFAQDKLKANVVAGANALTTSAVFKDLAWYHLVFAIDTTSATANNRVRIYINGSEITDFSNRSNPSQNADTNFNKTSVHYIGRQRNADPRYFAGYLADIYFIDGSALDATSFGAFDSNGVWQKADFSGTYGTNGFHLLDFENESTLGHDSSGNNNDFTANNLSATGVIASSAAVLNLPLNSTPFTDSSASSATVTNTGSISTTSAATNTFNISTVASLNGSSQRLTTNNNNISFQNNWTVDAYFIIDNGSTGFNALFNSGYGSQTSHYMYIGFDNSNKPYIETSSSGSRTTAANAINKNQWYHMRVIQKSGTITMYINGTSVLTKTAQTTDLSSQGSNTIGSFLDNANNASNFFGQLGPFRIINDALDAPSSGGEATSSGTLANTGTKTVASEIDVLFDFPANGSASDTGAGGEVSGNYATLNAVAPHGLTLSNGNLDGSGSVIQGHAPSTIFASSGKFYCEFTLTTYQADTGVGVAASIANPGEDWIGEQAYTIGYLADGRIFQNSSATNYSSYAANDVIGVAFDADTGKVWFSKNGTYQNSGDPAAGTGQVGTITGGYALGFTFRSVGGAGSFNFGARSFAYSAPSGFKALCTTNLPTPTIADGSDHFDVLTWTGDGTGSRSFTGLAFQPDFTWVKIRTQAYTHTLFDAVRGAGSGKELQSNSTNAEGGASTNVSGYLSAFNSDGFSSTAGSSDNDYFNKTGNTYVAWNWDAGSSTVSNTDGSITSQVRASQSSGFSIVEYTGNATNSSVGHGLNAPVKLILIKSREVSSGWAVYHDAIGTTTNNYIELQSTAAAAQDNTAFQNTAPTSSVFSIGTKAAVNNDEDSHIAYCFAPVEGYSAFGSYTGNGASGYPNADGPFIYLGFRPAFVLWKCTSQVENWTIYDSARGPFNYIDNKLNPNSSAAESTNANHEIDFLSNGFKVRNNNGEFNQNNGTYIYAAFSDKAFSLNGGLAR